MAKIIWVLLTNHRDSLLFSSPSKRVGFLRNAKIAFTRSTFTAKTHQKSCGGLLAVVAGAVIMDGGKKGKKREAAHPHKF